MFDSLNNVDWELLHKQKRALLTVLRTRQVMPSQAEALDGIVELLDALQDDAAEIGVWTFPGERTKKGGAR